MTAQEWLNELEGLREAATPGPWICKEGEGFDEDDLFITAEERDGMIDIAKIERGSPNAGMDEPFQSEQAANAAYIVAACNAVPRLVDMIEYLAGRLCDEDHGDNDFDGKIQDAFEMTEPIK